MASLSIYDTRITSVEKDQVHFIGIPIIDVTNPEDSYEIGVTVREERNHIVSGRVGEYALATESPTPYIPGGINGETANLIIQLNYQYREGEIIWGEEELIGEEVEYNVYNELAGDEYISDELPESDLDNLTEQIIYQLINSFPIKKTVIDPETNLPVLDEITGGHKQIIIGTTYVYNIYSKKTILPWEDEYDGWKEGRHELTFSFYTHPKEFSFGDKCKPNEQWQVDKGINSLLTNMLEFQGYATQWKYWKIQNDTGSFGNVTIDPCPNWDSPLSAKRLTSIYNYLGNSTTYVSGTKISAAMFNNLATLINN